jgi:hypothetical protein
MWLEELYTVFHGLIAWGGLGSSLLPGLLRQPFWTERPYTVFHGLIAWDGLGYSLLLGLS